MTNFFVCFEINGYEWLFDAKDVRRDTTDGAGGPILYVKCRQPATGKTGVANLTADWKIKSFCIN